MKQSKKIHPYSLTVEKLLTTKFLSLPVGLYLFILFVAIGMYLRFYKIESQDIVGFGWDQARDAWVVRDILQGKLTLIGPKTGVGNLHLGPLYYYLLAPFYFFFQFNPMASNYFNMLANLINYAAIFYTTKKIFKNYTTALFVIFIYSMSHYLIVTNQTPWNVTLVPAAAVMTFFAIWQIYQQKFRWFFVLATVGGIYSHLHFTFVFIPLIILLSLLFLPNKKKALFYTLLSTPFFLVWFIPILLYQLQSSSGGSRIFAEFGSNYFLGFHFKFFIHRFPDTFAEFSYILYSDLLKFISYFFLPIFLILCWFNKQDRLLGYLISLWFVIPWVGFTLYGGPITDYYFLAGAPFVLWILAYLQKRLLEIRYQPTLVLLTIFWLWYAFVNTQQLWIKQDFGGLAKKKVETKTIIQNGGEILYNEGDIRAYLFTIWTHDKKPMQ